MKGEDMIFFPPVTIVFHFLLKKQKGLRTQLSVERLLRAGRGNCHLTLQTLPAGSKELDRFCGTEKPSNNLMGPPDSTIMG